MFKRVLAYGVITLSIAGILAQLNSYLALVNIHYTPSIDEQDTIIAQPQYYHRDNTTLLSYISIITISGLLLLARSWIQKERYRKAKLLGLLGFTKISPWQHRLRYERQLFSCVTFSLIDVFKVGSLIIINGMLLFGMATSTVPESDPHHAGFEEPNLYKQSLSHRAAQLAVTNIAFSVLLSAKLSIIQRYFFEINETIRWHAWFGRIGFFQVLYHASYQIQTNYTNQSRSIVAALTSNVRHTTGAFMLSAMFLLLFGSHSLVRLISYRLFRITHLVGLVVLIGSGCFHHWSFYVFYVIVLLFWVMDQIDRSYRTDMLMAEALPGDIVKIKCNIPYFMNAGLIPGQFAFVSLTPSTFAAAVYAHPFSICRVDSNDTLKEEEEEGALSEDEAPARPLDGQYFTFYIKATGNRTKPLYDIAQSGSKAIKARISKPLGRPYVTSAGAEYGDFDSVILVAEGMGITPWISVLQYIEQKQHAIKTKSVNLIWSIHSIDTFYAFEEELQQFSDSLQLDLSIRIYITGLSDPEESYSIPNNLAYIKFKASGRPNYTALMQELDQQDNTTVVGVCAHESTIVKVNNLCLSYSWAIRKERFEL
ncbi:FAD binding protein [Mucor ambiguus]|uniref:FAD binding protein n=1 Tax=Mucor ambiguus TaxID=91626 RepID=A0A0C9LYJ0_9FUNG|nr:FAD binding protein [Mucor ambiguus]